MALALTSLQGLALVALYAVAFLAPAIWLAREMKRRGEPNRFAWVVLVLATSVLGLFEYRMDRRIRQRRGEGERK